MQSLLKGTCKFCFKHKKDPKLSKHTQQLVNNWKELLQRGGFNQQDLSELNTDISKILRKDLRKDSNKPVTNTIDENKSQKAWNQNSLKLK